MSIKLVSFDVFEFIHHHIHTRSSLFKYAYNMPNRPNMNEYCASKFNLQFVCYAMLLVINTKRKNTADTPHCVTIQICHISAHIFNPFP